MSDGTIKVIQQGQDGEQELIIKKEAVEELGAALEKIPERYKNVLEYKYILGLSDAEIGEKLGDFQWFSAAEVAEQAALPTAFRQFWDAREDF